MSESPVIELSEFSVRYGEFLAVDHLTLAITRGEVFGFVGPNGAGKSTTIRALLDLQRPTSGSVCLFGQPVRGNDAFRSRVGYLPGDLVLFPNLRVSETLDLFAGLQGRPAGRRDDVLAMLGFPDNARERRVSACSTGMRQMVGIAAAMQHDPELLILDEPTTGLDPLVREQFLDVVRTLAKEGKTILFSGHVLDEVEACAGRIGLIWKGQLQLVETVEELRRTRPRTAVLHYRDGRIERRVHQGPPAELIEALRGEDLVDLEIRPAGLREVFASLSKQKGR